MYLLSVEVGGKYNSYILDSEGKMCNVCALGTISSSCQCHYRFLF